jgi:plasmid stabilization system protein ParE
VPEVGRSEIREIFFGGYRLVYRISPRCVDVLTIRHGRRRFSREEIEPTE